MTASQHLNGNVPHDEWPATMDEFYAICTEDDLVKILVRDFYASPFAHYDHTLGEHFRAILRSQRGEPK